MTAAANDTPSEPPYRLQWPAKWRAPCVLSIPHSGQHIPADARAGLNTAADIGMLEDPFLDALAAALPIADMPVLTSCIGRAYCDVNRSETEWDGGMFRDLLPLGLSSDTGRVRAGLGTFPRFLPPRIPVNRRRLTLAEGERRWLSGHRPYHRALDRLVRAGRARFGYVVLLDLHSMPQMPGEKLPDLVLGDGFGRACTNAVSQAASRAGQEVGLSVARNYPYAGGYITQHYGRPALGLHALQLEFARPLYMDEKSRTLGPKAALVTQTVAAILNEISCLAPTLLQPAPSALAGED